MARPNRIRQIASDLSVDPDQWVLDALNTHETLTEAAEMVGVSPQALSEYARTRFEKVCRWRRVTFATTLYVTSITDESGERQ